LCVCSSVPVLHQTSHSLIDISKHIYLERRNHGVSWRSSIFLRYTYLLTCTGKYRCREEQL